MRNHLGKVLTTPTRNFIFFDVNNPTTQYSLYVSGGAYYLLGYNNSAITKQPNIYNSYFVFVG